MQLPASDTISEEANDDMAQNAADDDDDNDADAASDKGSVDGDVARMEKYLRLYFNSLAKSGTTCTVEEEFNLVTAKLGLFFKEQKFIVSNKCPNKGILHKSCSRKWKSLLNPRESGRKK